MALLELKNLHVSLEDGPEIVKGVDLAVDTDQVHAIMANDVRCTHGATLGRVDKEQLFYLMTRGLSRSEAERLIVRGFFQDILDRIDLEPVREALGAALEARIPQG